MKQSRFVYDCPLAAVKDTFKLEEKIDADTRKLNS